MKKVLRIIQILLVSLILASCGDPAEAAYNESVEAGIEYIESGDLENAEEQFNIALENKPEDEYAQTILEQIQLYQEAVVEFENDNKEQALERANEAANISEGSEELSERAQTLRDEIQEAIDVEIAEQKAREEEEARIQAEKEAEEQARKEEEARIQAEKEAEEQARKEEEARLQAEKEAAAAAAVTYDDVKGIYAFYDGSTLIGMYIFSNKYMTDLYTDSFHITAREIAAVNVNGKTLHLDYLGESGEYSPVSWEPGRFSAEFSYDENGYRVLKANNFTLYEMSRSEFDALGYSINDPEIFAGT